MPRRIYTDEERRERKNARQREYAKRTGYAAQNKYKLEKSVNFSFRLYTPQDNEMLEWLEAQPIKSGYLKSLIKADMQKSTSDES